MVPETRRVAEDAGSPAAQGDVPGVVDPLALSLASAPAAPVAAPEGAPPGVVTSAAGGGASVLDTVLAAEVLQRVAWGGDRRRGVARLELGGELEGAVVIVRGEGREVSVELSLPDGRHAGDLPERLSARLSARGLVVRELVVR